METAKGFQVSWPDSAWPRILRLLNAADALLTLCIVWALGVTDEMNPIMAAFMRVSPLLFVGVKLLGVAFLSEWLARKGRFGVLRFFSGVYAAVVALQLVILLNHASGL